MSIESDTASLQLLLELYDDALPQVYGYLQRRCGNSTVAEDLATEVFLGAVHSIKRGAVDDISVGWLIGIARHKLADHWRRNEREEHKVEAIARLDQPPTDPWECQLDMLIARDVLSGLGGHHRSALTLRYVDDLPVRQVAEVLGRTEQVTEALLVRARRAFRSQYEGVQR